MRVAIQKPLFAWDCLEDHPPLVTLRRLFESIPDGPLLEGLRTYRGRGRNDYPVAVLWRVIVLTIALRHRDFERRVGWPARESPAVSVGVTPSVGRLGASASPSPSPSVFPSAFSSFACFLRRDGLLQKTS